VKLNSGTAKSAEPVMCIFMYLFVSVRPLSNHVCASFFLAFVTNVYVMIFPVLWWHSILFSFLLLLVF